FIKQVDHIQILQVVKLYFDHPLTAFFYFTNLLPDLLFKYRYHIVLGHQQVIKHFFRLFLGTFLFLQDRKQALEVLCHFYIGSENGMISIKPRSCFIKISCTYITESLYTLVASACNQRDLRMHLDMRDTINDLYTGFDHLLAPL